MLVFGMFAAKLGVLEVVCMRPFKGKIEAETHNTEVSAS